jgi:hypothetical protein
MQADFEEVARAQIIAILPSRRLTWQYDYRKASLLTAAHPSIGVHSSKP